MKKRTMTRLLHGVLVVAALLTAGLFFYVLPLYGRAIRAAEPEFAWAYRPCLIWAWAFALPIFACIVPCWRIFESISAPGGPFTLANARRLKLVAALALADGVVFPAGMVILAVMGAGQAGLTVVVTPVVMFCCAAVAAAAWVLGCLVDEAARLREENELTI